MSSKIDSMPWFDELTKGVQRTLKENCRNIFIESKTETVVVKVGKQCERFYLRDFSSPEEMMVSAIEHREQLRWEAGKSHPQVSLGQCKNKTNRANYLYYLVKAEHEGVKYQKRFYLGKGPISVNRMLHGYRTAMVYGKYITLYGEGFNTEQFKLWRYKRLYKVGGELFQW